MQQEVTRALADPARFEDVAPGDPRLAAQDERAGPRHPDDDRAAFVVRDGSYVSARWPGDVHTFARTFADLLAEGA